MILGVGVPVAEQENVALSLYRIIWLTGGLIIMGGTEERRNGVEISNLIKCEIDIALSPGPHPP